jgi:cell division septum initiation protein DivIVA
LVPCRRSSLCSRRVLQTQRGGRAVTDSRMRGRVKGLFGGASPEQEILDHAPSVPEPEAQRQALQVLVLAQRTADDHIASARHEAEKIRGDARATADQIVREAQAHADGARRDANKALSEAQATAKQIGRDAKAHADDMRRDAEQVLSDARARAEAIGEDAQAKADELEREARQRYQEVLGSLPAKRAALQQQIEALQQFDRDYRNRLRKFMQNQLQALGTEEPPAMAEAHQPAAATAGPAPANE